MSVLILPMINRAEPLDSSGSRLLINEGEGVDSR
jgi:hypothetical protein